MLDFFFFFQAELKFMYLVCCMFYFPHYIHAKSTVMTFVYFSCGGFDYNIENYYIVKFALV